MEMIELTGFNFLKAHQDNRPEGIHLTNIMIRMSKDGRLQNWPDYKLLSPEDQDKYEKSFFEPGFLWEEVLSYVYGERWAKRPDPFLYEGVWLSPDGVFTPEQLQEIFGIKSNQPAICEIKWTSSKNDKLPDHPSKSNWIVQGMAYAYAMGLDRVVYAPCYWKADYKWLKLEASNGEIISCPTPPDPRAFMVKFTKDELQSNWDTIIKYRDILLEEKNQSFNRNDLITESLLNSDD